jgi:hypothetical protein
VKNAYRRRSPEELKAHFGGDVESITVGGRVVYRARSKADTIGKLGRVIRRYHTAIPIGQFDKWQDLLRQRARGCGLYALYSKNRLLYVGLATNSIRARVRAHLKRGTIPFTHFSVFLVTGRSAQAQARRIRDLEALLLNVLRPIPAWNKVKTNFVGARRLAVSA